MSRFGVLDRRTQGRKKPVAQSEMDTVHDGTTKSFGGGAGGGGGGGGGKQAGGGAGGFGLTATSIALGNVKSTAGAGQENAWRPDVEQWNRKKDVRNRQAATRY